MKWVTRRSIRVNRAATAWLIRRFIEPDATFPFVEREEVAEVGRRERARRFDAPGATYPYRCAQGRCSFEALAAEYCPDDAVLEELARIGRGADFGDAVSATPESAGLRALSRRCPVVASDDEETLEMAGFLYDSPCASLCERDRT